MRMSVSLIDILVIVLYFLTVIWLGFRVSAKSKSLNTKLDYILAGRKLTTPIFVGTLVATWYGNILGVGEFVYEHGVVAWLCFGITYYVAAFLYAFLVAGKIRKTDVFSIPEQITINYGKRNGIISSVIVLVITIPAVYILMLGILIRLFTGWELWISVVAGTVISIFYIYKGGFKSDVVTNVFQFVIIYIGFGAFLFFTISAFGSPLNMFARLPTAHKSLFGDFSWMYILSWVLIAFQTFVDPSFYQRCLAAKSPQVARRGILISVGFWLIFDILTLLTGLYAKAYFGNIDGVMAYPALSEFVLPVFWKGVFIITLLATIMSSLDSYAFLSAATIGNDIFSKLKIFRDYSVATLTRIGLITSGIVGILISLLLPSPIEIVFRTASVAVPGLIIPLIFTYNSKYKLKSEYVTFVMLLSSITSLILFILQSYKLVPEPFISIQPMFGGMLISIIISAFGIQRKPTG